MKTDRGAEGGGGGVCGVGSACAHLYRMTVTEEVTTSVQTGRCWASWRVGGWPPAPARPTPPMHTHTTASLSLPPVSLLMCPAGWPSGNAAVYHLARWEGG